MKTKMCVKMSLACFWYFQNKNLKSYHIVIRTISLFYLPIIPHTGPVHTMNWSKTISNNRFSLFAVEKTSQTCFENFCMNLNNNIGVRTFGDKESWRFVTIFLPKSLVKVKVVKYIRRTRNIKLTMASDC
jgi:hypothetical protein